MAHGLAGVIPPPNFSALLWPFPLLFPCCAVAHTRKLRSLGLSICRALNHVETGCIPHLSVSSVILTVSLFVRALVISDRAKVAKKQ